MHAATSSNGWPSPASCRRVERPGSLWPGQSSRQPASDKGASRVLEADARQSGALGGRGQAVQPFSFLVFLCSSLSDVQPLQLTDTGCLNISDALHARDAVALWWSPWQDTSLTLEPTVFGRQAAFTQAAALDGSQSIRSGRKKLNASATDCCLDVHAVQRLTMEASAVVLEAGICISKCCTVRLPAPFLCFADVVFLDETTSHSRWNRESQPTTCKHHSFPTASTACCQSMGRFCPSRHPPAPCTLPSCVLLNHSATVTSAAVSTLLLATEAGFFETALVGAAL